MADDDPSEERALIPPDPDLSRRRLAAAFCRPAGQHRSGPPRRLPVVLVVWLLSLAVTRWIALASVAAAASVLVIAMVAGEDRRWAALLAVVVIVRHRRNLTDGRTVLLR